MRLGFRQIHTRALCILAASGLLAASSPGCGDAAKQGQASGGVAPTVKESNDNMENFMKTQKSKKK